MPARITLACLVTAVMAGACSSEPSPAPAPAQTTEAEASPPEALQVEAGEAETTAPVPTTPAPSAPVQNEIVVVAEYPHDRAAYTQGLFIHEGQLYESTGRVGQSSLRLVDLETGEVLRSVDVPPPYFGEGSTQIGDEIFMLSWTSQQGWIFDAESFERVDSFTYPGEGWGLTTDGTSLIMSDGTDTLRFLDPADISLQRSLEITYLGRPMSRINELEWVDGEIWANIWMTTTIVRIDPETGRVTGQINLADLVPRGVRNDRDAVANGIAWNAETGAIYVTGKLWPNLYEIRMIGDTD